MSGAQGHEVSEVDPRVRRTRRLLQEGLAKLLQEKEFDKISIGEIAEVSTLNRATFYAHYPDKFALLECLVGAQFQDLIVERGIQFTGCSGALKNIAMVVCYYLAERIRPGAEGQRQASTPLETAIVAVVRGLMREGFAKHPPQSEVSAEMLSAMIAWAIYGAAREWAQGVEREPVEVMAGQIGGMLAPMLVGVSVRQVASSVDTAD